MITIALQGSRAFYMQREVFNNKLNWTGRETHHSWSSIAFFHQAFSTSLVPINGQSLMMIQFSSWGSPNPREPLTRGLRLKLLELGGKGSSLICHKICDQRWPMASRIHPW